MLRGPYLCPLCVAQVRQDHALPHLHVLHGEGLAKAEHVIHNPEALFSLHLSAPATGLPRAASTVDLVHGQVKAALHLGWTA